MENERNSLQDVCRPRAPKDLTDEMLEYLNGLPIQQAYEALNAFLEAMRKEKEAEGENG